MAASRTSSSSSFPSFDLSKLDLSKLDLSKLDLSKLSSVTLPDINVAGVDTDKVVGVLRDAVYVAIGFGVLTFQQAQVRRREIGTTLTSHPLVHRLGLSTSQVEAVINGLDDRLASFDSRFDAVEARLDTMVTRIEARLPEQAGVVLGQAHDFAKAARKQMRGLIRSAA